MSETHPDERDLINVAREQIGSRKKERIFEHCRECRPCADHLLELVREHAPPPGPLRLTRWHKVSIVLLLVSLVALAVVIGFWIRTLRSGAPIPPGILDDPAVIEEAARAEGPTETGAPAAIDGYRAPDDDSR